MTQEESQGGKHHEQEAFIGGKFFTIRRKISISQSRQTRLDIQTDVSPYKNHRHGRFGRVRHSTHRRRLAYNEGVPSTDGRTNVPVWSGLDVV